MHHHWLFWELGVIPLTLDLNWRNRRGRRCGWKSNGLIQNRQVIKRKVGVRLEWVGRFPQRIWVLNPQARGIVVEKFKVLEVGLILILGIMLYCWLLLIAWRPFIGFGFRVDFRFSWSWRTLDLLSKTQLGWRNSLQSPSWTLDISPQGTWTKGRPRLATPSSCPTGRPLARRSSWRLWSNPLGKAAAATPTQGYTPTPAFTMMQWIQTTSPLPMSSLVQATIEIDVDPDGLLRFLNCCRILTSCRRSGPSLNLTDP